jgi:CHAT domain-containing protein
MARKWGLFFHRLFVVLSCRNPHRTYLVVPRYLHRAVYVVLGFLSVLGCLLAAPSGAKVPIDNITPIGSSEETAIAQSSPSIPAVTSAEQFEQAAREKYAVGQFQEAAVGFQQAAQRYGAQGNLLQQALSLSNLSLSNQQLGNWTDAVDAIARSLSILQTELQQQNTPDRQSAYAQALDIRAKLELSRGQAEAAIATWKQSTSIHTQLGHRDRAAESEINQARALQRLGLHNRAIVLLQTVLKSPEQPTLILEGLETLSDEITANGILQQRLQVLPATTNTVIALQNLGDSLQIIGSLKQAQQILHYSLKLAQQMASSGTVQSSFPPGTAAAIHLSLGNVIRAEAIADLQLNNMSVKQAVAQLQKHLSPVQQELQRRWTDAAQAFDTKTEEALAYYQQATDSSSPAIQVQAHLNRLNLLLDKQQTTAAKATLAQINSLLNRLPPSRTGIDAHINFAQSLKRLPSAQTDAQRLQAAQLLATAHQQAIALGDLQAESYVLGSLGQLYEESQQWTDAAALTQQALAKVNAVSTPNLPHTITDTDLVYRWQYQLGRIRVAQDDRAGAIAAYETAARILKDWLSLDVASSNLSYQFLFNQDAQQPVHQAWMDLLLQSDNPSQQDLNQVREISTSLLETQLNSFLQEPCTAISPREVDRIVEESKTAIFYPVILPDRLEVIVRLPGSTDLQRYQQKIPSEQLSETLNSLQIALEEDYTFEAVERLSKQLYDWLVEPIASQLEEKQIDTLVFTLDRRLQNIPMAALYDGKQYLIEKYAISEILGLKFDSSNRPLKPEELKVIGAGLSTAPTVQTAGGEDIQRLFLPLNYVKDEMEVISKSGISAETLIDNEFTLATFNTRLNEQKFPIVHLATHGQFSFNPKRTFLLTAEQEVIDVDKLAALFRVRGQIRLDAIELLILNACETAAGDDLATLGIAGAAVRAGARSAIASLWTLDDAPNVSFTKTLYKNLRQSDISRAEAMRQAQLVLLQNPQYKHPRYWSPYVLAGNWLPLTTSRSTGTTGSKTSS